MIKSERDAPLSILIVEDNEANLDVIERRLQRRGYRTASARNGREACDCVRQLQPFLILMDLEMPIMSGFDALREIRTIPALATTRIVAVTAHATKEIRQKCDAAGFDDFITKPIDLRALLAVIEKAGVKPDAPAPASPPGEDGE